MYTSITIAAYPIRYSTQTPLTSRSEAPSTPGRSVIIRVIDTASRAVSAIIQPKSAVKGTTPKPPDTRVTYGEDRCEILKRDYDEFKRTVGIIMCYT